MSVRSRGWLTAGVILAVLMADQALKIWIKTHLALYEHIRITDWFYIYFTENEGMAFGIELFDKFFLTAFRILAAGVLIWYLHRIYKKQTVSTGYCICIALIIAGALGNILDSLFYGLIFNHSFGQVATLFPPEGGYAPFFYGRVVDMLYFPLIDTYWPIGCLLSGGTFYFF
jgi:signal peptidase II